MTGALEWRWLDSDTQLLIEPGTLLLLHPDMREYFQWHRHRVTTHGWVHFDITPPPVTTGWPLTRPNIAPGPFGGQLDYLLWLAEEPTQDWQTHVDQTIANLLRTFLTAPVPNTQHPAEPPLLTTTLDYVQREWANNVRPVSVTELADLAAVSKGHLSRLFRQHFGTSVINALELVRLDRAANLLARSNLSITKVAHSCGYQDPLYFSRRFRTVFGIPPRQYRQHGSYESPLVSVGLLPLARRLTECESASVSVRTPAPPTPYPPSSKPPIDDA